MTTPTFNGARHVLDGVSVYCVDTAPGATDRPTVVAVHGIPESCCSRALGEGVDRLSAAAQVQRSPRHTGHEIVGDSGGDQ